MPVRGSIPSGASIVRALSATIVRPVAQSFLIEGGHSLSGRLRAAGNKNGALPILASCLLTDEPHFILKIRCLLEETNACKTTTGNICRIGALRGLHLSLFVILLL